MSEASAGVVIGSTAEEMRSHYDEGNAFFALWLDPTMSYSCALFEEGDDLERAQKRKLDYHLTNVGATRGHRLLDVGCGWGALLHRAVDRFGVAEAVGITLAQEQARFVNGGHRSGVRVEVEHWADFTADELFDGIVSIGSFEHFARHGTPSEQKIVGYREFFRRCWSWLRPGGMMSLQTIVYGNMAAAEQSAFLTNEVFPASELPTLAELAEAFHGLFEIRTLRNDRSHYEETNRTWLQALRRNQAAAVRIAGERTVEKYKRYLRLSVLSFHLGNVDLLRLQLRRIDRPRLPHPEAP